MWILLLANWNPEVCYGGAAAGRRYCVDWIYETWQQLMVIEAQVQYVVCTVSLSTITDFFAVANTTYRDGIHCYATDDCICMSLTSFKTVYVLLLTENDSCTHYLLLLMRAVRTGKW
jgi:hypothetical protein